MVAIRTVSKIYKSAHRNW